MRNIDWFLLFGIAAGFSGWSVLCVLLVGAWLCLTAEDILNYYMPPKQSCSASFQPCGMKPEESQLKADALSSKLSTTEQRNPGKAIVKSLQKSDNSLGTGEKAWLT